MTCYYAAESFNMNEKKIERAESCKKSSKKLKSAPTVGLQRFEQSPYDQLNISLPKITDSQELNLFNLLTIHANTCNLFFKVPLSMIRFDKANCSHLIYNDSSGRLISRPCHDQEFFELSLYEIGVKRESSLYCFKISSDDPKFIYTRSEAQNT